MTGYMGDKHEQQIVLLLYYYPNVVESVTVTIQTCDKNYSTSPLSKSINRHMKEKKLNKDSGQIIFLNIPNIGKFLYGYN